MTRRIAMQWNLRQVMATRAIYQTSELVPMLAERGVSLSREHVYRLVTRTPQRLNMEIQLIWRYLDGSRMNTTHYETIILVFFIIHFQRVKAAAIIFHYNG